MVYLHEDNEWKAVFAMPTENTKLESELRNIWKDVTKRVKAGGHAMDLEGGAGLLQQQQGMKRALDEGKVVARQEKKKAKTDKAGKALDNLRSQHLGKAQADLAVKLRTCETVEAGVRAAKLPKDALAACVYDLNGEVFTLTAVTKVQLYDQLVGLVAPPGSAGQGWLQAAARNQT